MVPDYENLLIKLFDDYFPPNNLFRPPNNLAVKLGRSS